jgi:hypothetical protein
MWSQRRKQVATINKGEDLNRSISEFITTELKLGLHFAEYAVRYSREGRSVDAESSFQAAHKGYQAVHKLLPKATLNVTQKTELKKQLTLLKDSFDNR